MLARVTSWSLAEISDMDCDELLAWLESAKAVLNAK